MELLTNAMKDVSFVAMKKEIFSILIQIKKNPMGLFKRVILIYLKIVNEVKDHSL